MATTIIQNPAIPLNHAATSVPQVRMDDTSPFQRVGFTFLLVFLFLAFSRIFDVKFSFLHITGIAYRAAFAMTLLSGAFMVALKTNIGRSMLGFTICFGLSVPFSLWKGGSMPIFKDGWLMFSFVMFLATAGLILNYSQTQRAVNSLAWGLFTFVVIANVFGTMESGRLFLPNGKFANPNEMAQALLIGLPLWAAKMTSSQDHFKKLFAAGVIAAMLFTVFRTGSRGAMIAFAVMALLMFVRATVMGKMQMVLGGILLAGVLLTVMPGRLVSRYKTIANEDVEDDEMDAGMRDSALNSTQSRKALLKNSIKFTIRHPLFGVGPGMFVVADDNEAHDLGMRRGQWLGTHNSYTQVSSELGVPAFCFFVAAIVMATRDSYRLYVRTRGDPRTADIGSVALGLHYAMIVYAVTILFEHIAYSVMLPVFGGLVSALVRTSASEIERRLATPEPQVMTAPHFRTYSSPQAI
jgi:hypothetical protein